MESPGPSQSPVLDVTEMTWVNLKQETDQTSLR